MTTETPLVAAQVVALLAAGLLVVSGAVKLRSPGTLAGPLDRLGLPASLARPLGLAEAAVGSSALVAGGAAFVVVGLAYGVLLGVAARLRASGAACGCLGEASAPVGRTHLVVNALGAVGGVVAGLAAAPGLGSAAGPELLLTLLVLAVGVAVLRLLLTSARELRDLREVRA